MKFIYVAPDNEQFGWQVSLAFYQHLKVGYDKEDFIVLSPWQNMPSDKPKKSNFPPHIAITKVKSWWSYLGVTSPDHNTLTPIAIQTSLAQIDIDDNEVYIVLDADMFFFFKKEFNLEQYDAIHDPVYENWHLLLHTRHSGIKKLIKTDFTHSGFVPIAIRGAALKLILPDWIKLHQQCYDQTEDPVHKWWAGMYSYNLACAKHSLKIKEERLCMIPGKDIQLSKETCCVHYSVQYREFDKKKYHTYSKQEKSIAIPLNESQLDPVGMIFFSVLKSWLHDSSGGREEAPG